jgi:hypothetical protein
MPTQTLTASSMAGLLAAIDTAAAQPGTDWTVLLAPGAYGAQGSEAKILGKVFNGRVTDHNLGVPIPLQDRRSRATVAGGSVTIRSVEPLGARILDRITVLGSGPFVFEGLDFRAQATKDQGDLPDGTTDKGQATAWSQLDVDNTATYPVQRDHVVRDCRFGGHLHGSPSTRWIMSCRLPAEQNTVIEDCEFDGVSFGPNAATIRRVSVRQQAIDACRMGFGSGPQPARRIYDSIIFEPNQDPAWKSQHGDGVQVGSRQTTEPVWIEIYRNIIVSETPMQAIFNDDTKGTIGGGIWDNWIFTRHVNGLVIFGADGLEVAGNRVLAFPNGVYGRAVTKPLIKVNANCRNLRVSGNTAHQIAGKGLDPSVVIDGNRIVPCTGDGYNAAFAGPFSGGKGWPLAAVDMTSPAALRADLLARFAPRGA